jgi:hypothetical protein
MKTDDFVTNKIITQKMCRVFQRYLAKRRDAELKKNNFPFRKNKR